MSNKNSMVVITAIVYGLAGAGFVLAYDRAVGPVIVEKETVIERPYVVDVASSAINDDVMCLAHNVFFEARGESVEGQSQVALVTLNRVRDKRWPDTVCGVVYQKAQFSWTLDKPYMDLKKADERRAYHKAIAIAQGVLSGEIPDNSGGATHYFNYNVVQPAWAESFRLVQVVDNHEFRR